MSGQNRGLFHLPLIVDRAAAPGERLGRGALDDLHGAGATVDADGVAGADALVPTTVLITHGTPSSRRHDRAVAHRPAHVDDQRGRDQEVPDPTGVGRAAHEDLTRLQRVAGGRIER